MSLTDTGPVLIGRYEVIDLRKLLTTHQDQTNILELEERDLQLNYKHCL